MINRNERAIQKYNLFSTLPFTDQLKHQAELIHGMVQDKAKVFSIDSKLIFDLYVDDEETLFALSVMFVVYNGEIK